MLGWWLRGLDPPRTQMAFPNLTIVIINFGQELCSVGSCKVPSCPHSLRLSFGNFLSFFFLSQFFFRSCFVSPRPVMLSGFHRDYQPCMLNSVCCWMLLCVCEISVRFTAYIYMFFSSIHTIGQITGICPLPETQPMWAG